MIWTMKPTAKKLEDVETKIGNVGSTDLQSQITTLNSKIISELIPTSSFTLSIGNPGATNAGYKVLGLYNIRLILYNVTISNETNIAQIADSRLHPLATSYLRVYDYSTGQPINGSLYVTTAGVLTYYGESLTNKNILIHDCFAVNG